MPEIVVSEQADLTRQKICEWLGEATQSAGYNFAPEHLLLQVVDDDGDIIGGLAGTTNWNWLYIETLAVAPQHRNRGYARELIDRAEEIARERGCCGSWVDTFTFQVPEFYQGLGYEPFGELARYPDDQSRLFLRKYFEQ